MAIKLRPISGLLVLGVLLALLSGCATEKRVTRVDTGVTTDLSGRWNDTDSKQVAEKMIAEMLSRPWLNQFATRESRQPTVIVGTVQNWRPGPVESPARNTFWHLQDDHRLQAVHPGNTGYKCGTRP